MNAKTLKRYRAARGWTQAELARRARVARVTVARLEGTRRWTPELMTAQRIAKALAVPLGALLDGPGKVEAEGRVRRATPTTANGNERT
jgi:transcriptional regulator with XRE-family HTH domain